MKIRGSSWLVGTMAMHLVACGDASSEEEPQALREAVRRERPPHPKPRPDCVADVTANGGYESALCAGTPTRRVRVVGNLSAEAYWPWPFKPFDAQQPANTSSFSTTFIGVDDQGRPQWTSIYFGRLQQSWEYHVLIEGTAIVIGAGHVSFDDQGVITVDVQQELRLLTGSGPGHAVELDISGMTQLSGPFQIISQEVDGSEARWGDACGSSDLPPAEVVTGPQCAAVATTRLQLRANLGAATRVAHQPWKPCAPSGSLTLQLQANDAQGTPIAFDLYLRKAGAQTWDYHVLLAGDGLGNEVANGSLHFNPNGSLGSVITRRALRFPSRDGVLGAPIELDFGAGVAGGSGVDGVTSMPGGSFEVWQKQDGVVLDCLPRVSSDPLPSGHPISCAGERTTAVGMSFNLDPAAATHSASATLYDAALVPRQLELHFRRIADRHWQCDVVASSALAGVVDLHFAANGTPSLIENIPVLRLPLADGSAGPPIQLGFDQGWNITSFAGESSGWLAANGAAARLDGCVK